MNSDNIRPKSLAVVPTVIRDSDIKERAKRRVEELRGMVSDAAQSNNTDNNTTLPRTKLKTFKDHPFKVKDDKKMFELVDSIRKYGILQSLLVRPSDDGLYEIIAGHRRNRGAELAGIDDVPVKILNVNDDDAQIIMAFTNTTGREDLLPSEKAKAYRIQKDAFKRQGKRSDLFYDDSEIDEESIGWDSSQMVADLNEENKRDIARYIRLTYLVPELLELVDSGDIAFRPAVDLSYLTEQEQDLIVELICSGAIKKITGTKAEELKRLSRNEQINETVIKMVLSTDSNSGSSNSYKIFEQATKKALNHFKKVDYSDVQINQEELEKIIVNAIESYAENKKDLPNV